VHNLTEQAKAGRDMKRLPKYNTTRAATCLMNY